MSTLTRRTPHGREERVRGVRGVSRSVFGEVTPTAPSPRRDSTRPTRDPSPGPGPRVRGGETLRLIDSTIGGGYVREGRGKKRKETGSERGCKKPLSETGLSSRLHHQGVHTGFPLRPLPRIGSCVGFLVGPEGPERTREGGRENVRRTSTGLQSSHHHPPQQRCPGDGSEGFRPCHPGVRRTRRER